MVGTSGTRTAASQNAEATTSLRVVGTEGEIYVEPAYHMETEIRITRGETTFDLDTPQVDQMQELFAYFAHRVLADEPMTPTGSHGLVDLQAMEAIYEAGTTGETVEIELET